MVSESPQNPRLCFFKRLGDEDIVTQLPQLSVQELLAWAQLAVDLLQLDQSSHPARQHDQPIRPVLDEELGSREPL